MTTNDHPSGMKIYFAGSIRGGRKDQEQYKKLIDYLRNFGTVLTEHVGLEAPEKNSENGLQDSEIYERDMKWIAEANALVAEVTVPSLGVGYEIRRAIDLQIPVLCLFRPHEEHQLSAMISGSPHVNVIVYSSINEAFTAIQLFIDNCVLTK